MINYTPMLLGEANSIDTIVECLWALSFYIERVDEKESKIQNVINLGLSPRIVDLLDDEREIVIVPASRLIMNMAYGQRDTVRRFYSVNIVSKMNTLICSRHSRIRYNALWATHSLMTGDGAIAADFGVSAIYKKVIFIAANDPSIDCRVQALSVIASFYFSQNQQIIDALTMSYGAIDMVIEALRSYEEKIVLEALSVIQVFFIYGMVTGDSSNPAVNFVSTHHGLGIFYELQNKHSEVVYKRVIHIIEEFFGGHTQELNN